jgi:hypothetical protein
MVRTVRFSRPAYLPNRTSLTDAELTDIGPPFGWVTQGTPSCALGSSSNSHRSVGPVQIRCVPKTAYAETTDASKRAHLAAVGRFHRPHLSDASFEVRNGSFEGAALPARMSHPSPIP